MENKIKFLIFDLDGVLINSTKELHFRALNEALGENYSITWEEHLSTYDGLKTSQKLDLLSERKGLPKSLHNTIWETKQKITSTMFDNIMPSEKLVDLMQYLSNKGYKLAVCSNSIRKTVQKVLGKLYIIEYFDLILSNEDIKNSKPHPEIYWTAMAKMSFLPEETLIFEDSPYGLLAASRSKANVYRVSDPSELNISTIDNLIGNSANAITTPKWVDKKTNIIIPMAGAGSRFKEAGYVFPKPLIEVNGKPMIQVVVDNININANYIYVVQKEHREKYNLDSLLNLVTPGCKIIESDGLTDGAACTALLAKEYIDNDLPLFFANSDQFVEWDSNEFMYKMLMSDADGGIVTFTNLHPKWSYAKVNERGDITEVAEKNPISDRATCGFYWWKRGSDFVKYAEQMISKDIRTNNEFYVAPVFNEAINDDKIIKEFRIEKMYGLGTPTDLQHYLDNYKK
jgi:HAD superfamily hydrolase (TIGR01509 family)